MKDRGYKGTNRKTQKINKEGKIYGWNEYIVQLHSRSK